MATFKVGPQVNSDEQSVTSQVDGLFGKNKKQPPFSQKAKNYFLDVCWTGEETSKATASDMAKYRV